MHTASLRPPSYWHLDRYSLAAAALLTVILSSTALAEPGVSDSASPAPAAPDMPVFGEAFAGFATLPDAPVPPPHTVDITTFEPPLEPETKPAIEGAQAIVIRSLDDGVASYYGGKFHGRLTANGERFDMYAMTAAHKTLPFGTKIRVTNRANGQSVIVRINDRGPFIRGRTIDLSRAAAKKIGLITAGHAQVQLDIIG